ncbi:MAG: propanediol dehydratase, partial [Clostridia bacterium]|nr:propanediol dehydratase [Clostridia bacterium]
MKSNRFKVLGQRPVHQDGFVKEWEEVGFVAMDSKYDPKPSLKIENGIIVEMDGKTRDEFDFIDSFIADHAIDLSVAEKAMAIDSLQYARDLCDINTDNKELKTLFSGLTAAKLKEIMNHMNVVEMMMAMQKMRERKTPS